MNFSFQGLKLEQLFFLLIELIHLFSPLLCPQFSFDLKIQFDKILISPSFLKTLILSGQLLLIQMVNGQTQAHNYKTRFCYNIFYRYQLMKFLLIIFIAFLTQIYAKTYNCVFDQLYANYRPELAPTDKLDQGITQHHHGRQLLVVSRTPMRITLDTTDFSTIKAGANGAAATKTANLNFILRAMQVAASFYMGRLQVTQLSRINSPTTCFDFTTPVNDRTNGIASSDLHIYVRYLTDKNIGYGATGIACKYFTTTTAPDSTLQAGRPTVGRIIFNTFTLLQYLNITSESLLLSNLRFSSITATALHEICHILGFSSTLYSTYLDPGSVDGDVYASTITPNVQLNPSRSKNSTILTTPYVKQWVRDFFACQDAPGMQLENQDGTGAGSASHWERVLMYDQLMTGTSLGAQKGFSGLTFAILKDMGWYTVDDTWSDTTNYGYHLGCQFMEDACYGTVDSKYFCQFSTTTNVSLCDTNFLGKATCTNASSYMADGCGILGQYFACVDPAGIDDGYKQYTLQSYGTSSFCVASTFSNVAISSNIRSRCYPYVCNTVSQTITFSVGTYSVVCAANEAGLNKTISALTGVLTCPHYESFCIQSRKICKNWCSKNGFCTRGVCNCYTGFSGQDCSITTCTSTQFYNPSTTLCVGTCPSGTYQNIYSRTCLPCASTCDQCSGYPDVCTSCQSSIGNPQVFYNGNCYSACPSYTYKLGDVCINCDTSVHCKTCSMAATNCTSCLNGRYLQNPTSGSCGLTCPNPTYSLQDVINFLCVDTCTDNLVLDASTCDLCPLNQFKWISDSDCHPDCQPKFYQNSDRRFCQQCDDSCLQCDGQYAQNCTSCASNTPLKYLLLKMCVSTCPAGFYPNDDSGACQICTVQLKCATCELDANDDVVCVTCNYGFYYQQNQTCTTGCDQYYYKNTWNHSCDPCSLDCGDCTSPYDSSCTNCRQDKYFLTNITGGYCLDECPTQNYVGTTTSCLPCHSTCLECNGVTSSDCFSCVQGLYLYDGYCRYVCPQQTYPDDTLLQCKPCDPDCNFCFAETVDNCTSCKGTLVLNNFTCQAECPTGMIENDWGVCQNYSESLKFLIMGILMLLLLFTN